MPIKISSLEELQKIGNDPYYPLNGEYELTKNINASDSLLLNHNRGFKPLGCKEKPFTGKFDGKGYKIYKLHINQSEYNMNFSGLFAFVGVTGKVLNLGLVDLCISIKGGAVGGIIGENQGTLSNCYSTGNISGVVSVGGLVGINDGKVENCYSICNVSGSQRTGGLVGHNGDKGILLHCYCIGKVTNHHLYSGGVAGYNEGTITECYSDGNVVGYYEVGGLVGRNESKILYCYSTGNVCAHEYELGGLVGRNNGTVQQCYSTGLVMGLFFHTGGLVGKNEYQVGKVEQSYWDVDSSELTWSAGGEGISAQKMMKKSTYEDWDFNNIWAIEEDFSYPYLRALVPNPKPSPPIKKEIRTLEELAKIGVNKDYPLDGRYILTADIDASKTLDQGKGKGFKQIKTFKGVLDGKGHKIIHLYINRPEENHVGLFSENQGIIRGIRFITTYVSGEEDVGSIVGTNRGMVRHCYSIGMVLGECNIGGMVGKNQGILSQCHSESIVNGLANVGVLVGANFGKISDSCSTLIPSGSLTVGGVAGKNYGTISHSYSISKVPEYSEEVGKLVGYNRGTIINCYWDMELSGENNNFDKKNYAIPERMMQKSTYVDWDFSTVWGIQENISYPYLKALGPPQKTQPFRKEINNLEELRKIGRSKDYPWDGHYFLTSDIDASDTLNWEKGKGFKPITVFTGIFDGNGHKIYNLHVNRPNTDNVGLFGVNCGKILNLELENVIVSGRSNVGALVGENIGTLMHCYISGRVSGTMDCIGGLVGSNAYSGEVSKCYSTAFISGIRFTGGLIGYNDGAVNECFSTGIVTEGEYIGGLVGLNRCSIWAVSYTHL
ncbi:MAG: hypothetical protein N3G21_03065, partial [Candidatus Hydrogenedentes bacterium]|nr:hypothetical protein [Candidatus Hydrogenedentota bacterium]